MINSGLGKVGFLNWVNNTLAKDIFPDYGFENEKIIDILSDDFFKAEDLYTMMEQAFKAGIFFKS